MNQWQSSIEPSQLTANQLTTNIRVRSVGRRSVVANPSFMGLIAVAHSDGSVCLLLLKIKKKLKYRHYKVQTVGTTSTVEMRKNALFFVVYLYLL